MSPLPIDDRFSFKAHLTIGRIQPSHMLKKGSIKRAVLELLAMPTDHRLHPIVLTQLGLYESGQIIPCISFDLWLTVDGDHYTSTAFRVYYYR